MVAVQRCRSAVKGAGRFQAGCDVAGLAPECGGTVDGHTGMIASLWRATVASWVSRRKDTAVAWATGAATTYTHDGAGHRVSKTAGTTTTTRCAIGPNAELPNVIAETNAAGTGQCSCSYGLLSQIAEATSQP